MSERNFVYPESRQDDVIEDYHGTVVSDPYRWLEDPDDAETIAWGEAQNNLTFDYLSEIPARERIHKRLTQLWNYPRYSVPKKKGDRYFLNKNNGLQNQPILYYQEGLEGELIEILNPNAIREDGTVALMTMSPSEDGKKLVYGLSSGGSDWQEIRIRNIETGEDYDETLNWCKFAGIAWKEDGSGFYYNRFPNPEMYPDDVHGAYHNQVYWHTVDTPQSADVLIYARPDAKELNFVPMLTDDGEFLVLYVWHGSVNQNRIYYRRENGEGDFVHLLNKADAHYGFIGNDGTMFYFETNHNAPRGRIIAIDIEKPDSDDWVEIVPQQPDVILDAQLVNHQFVVKYMHDAHHRISIFERDGSFIKDIPLPAMGTIESISGERGDVELFMLFESYLYPPTVFRYDFATGETTSLHPISVDFPTDQYETKQVLLFSKDGTRVPMFVTAKKGITLDGSHPTWLYGYGGFSLAYTPVFHPWIMNWLDLGGVFAVANLRGGDEYGEKWHKAGMLENKQNVFDDFIAAGEALIAEGYTRSDKLAIMGRSNGGLLVGACMLQRPDLFGAVICIVPVTDMLRYHKFTAGRFWTYEYGNAQENADHFKFMYAYSPLHNVKEGETYPPTLITSADKDDRVVPMHAKKFTAALQAGDSGQNPILLRLDFNSGHGLGKPVSKWIDEWADIQAFLVRNLKMDV